jgi:hypothetical protein
MLPPDDQLEKAYYLPPEQTGLTREFTANGGDQHRYVELCQRGHDLIANAIIEGRSAGKLPSIKTLYQIAAKVRRAIAWENMGDAPDVHAKKCQYGMPLMREDARLVDDISARAGSRYERFYPSVKAFFDELRQMDAAHFAQAFGAQYRLEVSHLRQPNHSDTVCTISREGKQVAALREYKHDGVITFSHTSAEDRDAALAQADVHLQRLLSAQPPLSGQEYDKEMGALSLELFHCAPLLLGSQTATLMVLAGVEKALGRQVTPRALPTDHFVEAEITPYARYIEAYKASPVAHDGGVPGQPLPVNTDFIEHAQAKMQKAFDAPDPLDRLGDYLGAAAGKASTRIEVQGFTVGKDGSITQLRLPLFQNATYMQKALDFIGPEASKVLRLPEGRYERPKLACPPAICDEASASALSPLAAAGLSRTPQ